MSVQTVRQSISESQATRFQQIWRRDYGLALQSNGSEWVGTFGVMVRALIDDLLNDGEPVRMELLYEPTRIRLGKSSGYMLITAEVNGWDKRIEWVDNDITHRTDVITFTDGGYAVIEGLIGVFV